MAVKVQRPGDPGHPGDNKKTYVRVNYRGHRKTRVFTSGRAAQNYADHLELLLRVGKPEEVSGVFADPAPETAPAVPTFGAYWMQWFAMEQAGWKPRTAATYARVFETHLRPLVDLPLSDLTRQAVKNLVAGKLSTGNLASPGKPMAPNSVKGILVPLRECLQAAADDGILAANPAARVKVPQRKDQTKADSLERYTREELVHILTVCREQMPAWYPAILTAARTGLRVGELCGLRMEDLSFDRRSVHVRRAISRRIEGTPKNGKARTVDMSGQLAAVLQDHLRGRDIAATVDGRAPTPWVFGSLDTGRYLNDEVLAKQVWPRLLRLAGARPLKFHALRHTFASLLIEQGESLAYIRDQLGHASIQITVDIYGHLIPGANRQAVDRLDDPEQPPQDGHFRNRGATEAPVVA